MDEGGPEVNNASSDTEFCNFDRNIVSDMVDKKVIMTMTEASILS